MKTLIMEQTVTLLCKTQEDVDKLLQEGYEIKQVKETKYLVKNEIL